jgi:hypothetical protein
VIFHLYGTAEIKKLDVKTLAFDFEFFEQITTKKFTDFLETELSNFMASLYEDNASGKLYSS